MGERQKTIDSKMKEIKEQQAIKDKQAEQESQGQLTLEDERKQELEERAVRLMESTRTIELGKNLEKGVVQKDVRSKKLSAKPSEPKASKKPRAGGTDGSEAADRSPTRGDGDE